MEKTLTEKKAMPGTAEFSPLRTALIKPRVILRYLAACIVLLIAAHLVGLALINKFPKRQFANTINRLFNLDLEANIPTFFSAMLIIVGAVLLFFISTQVARHKMKWKSLGFIFIFLSVDEAAQIHEETIYVIRKYLLFGATGLDDFDGFLTYSWVILYGLIFIGIVFYFFKFVFALPPRTRNLFIVSGFIYVSGALGFEMIGGHIEKLYSRNALWWFCTTLEETLEMTGMSLFLYALLDYISKMNITINFAYENKLLK